MKWFTPSSLAAFGLVLSLSTAGSAQDVPCFLGDDGFDLGCCKEAHPNLPKLPEIKIEGLYGCMQDCKIQEEFKVVVRLGQPDFFLCDTAVIPLEVFPQSPGGPAISAKLIAKYSRTWMTSEDGKSQVWRFLLNGDWEYDESSTSDDGCPTPPHKNPAHAIGSIDYTCDPTGSDPSTQVALNLSHLPGCIAHGHYSARPLSPAEAHDDRSYHLVAPANFSWGVVSDIHGFFQEDAVRSSPFGSQFPSSYRCLSEAPVRKGEMFSSFKNCLCSDFEGAWMHSDLKGVVECNGSFGFSTWGFFDPIVPTGLAGLRLGRWSGPAFPGDSELTVFVGYFRYENPCKDLTDDEPHRVFGVGTLGEPGWLFNSETGEAERVFMDLQDSLVQVPSPTLPVFKKIFGAPAFASLVWNLNPRP